MEDIKNTQALDIANEAKRIARANIAGELVVIVLCDLIDRLALPPPAVADVTVEGKPFGYFHELLDHEGKGQGIWLGCDDRSVVEQSYTEGEVGKEIVTLYAAVAEVNVQASEREKFEQHWACCGFVPDGANPDHIYAAMQSGWMGHAALSHAAVRVEDVKRMKIPADDGPIKGEAIAQRMTKICGCKGQYDCNCVSVKNMALRELWGEHNAATRSKLEANNV